MTAITASRNSRGTRLLAAMEVARNNNPMDNGLASGVTVTTAAFASKDASLGNGFGTTDGSVLQNASKWRCLGGTPTPVSAGIPYIRPQSVAVIDGSLTGPLGRFVIRTDEPKIECRILNSQFYRIIVDDGTGPKFVSRSFSQVDVTSGSNVVAVDFSGVRKIREITYELHQTGPNKFYIPPNRHLFTPATPLRLGFYSDSYGASQGVSYYGLGLSQIIGDLLGMPDVWSMSLGGTGYIYPSVNANYWKYADHVNDIALANPDLLIIGGGTNDTASQTSDIALAAGAFFDLARAKAPNIPIVVLGPWSRATGPSATIIAIEAAVQAAIAARNDPYAAFIPVSPSAADAIIYGTGYASATNSSGNSDYYLGGVAGTDFDHLGSAGHEYVARHLAPLIRSAVRAMFGFGA